MLLQTIKKKLKKIKNIRAHILCNMYLVYMYINYIRHTITTVNAASCVFDSEKINKIKYLIFSLPRSDKEAALSSATVGNESVLMRTEYLNASF